MQFEGIKQKPKNKERRFGWSVKSEGPDGGLSTKMLSTASERGKRRKGKASGTSLSSLGSLSGLGSLSCLASLSGLASLSS